MKKRSKFRKTVDARQNKEIKKLQTQVKGLIEVHELKLKDYQFGDEQIPSFTIGDYKYNITDLSPWDTNATNSNANRLSAREGNEVNIKRVAIDAIITLPSNQIGNDDATYDALVRVMVVHTPDSVYADLAEVLQNPYDIFSALKHTPDNPYRLLFDKRMSLQSTTQIRGAAVTGVNAAAVEPFRRNLKITLSSKDLGKTGLNVQYGQGNGGQQPIMGGLQLICISTVAGATFVKPILTGTIRLRFLDQ